MSECRRKLPLEYRWRPNEGSIRSACSVRLNIPFRDHIPIRDQCCNLRCVTSLQSTDGTELGVLNAPAIELLCTAGSGPSTIAWASALVALCSSLERFVIIHMAFPSWCFISFHSSSFLLLYYFLFLPSCYFTLPFLGQQMYIMCLPEEFLLGQGFLLGKQHV